MPVYELTTQGVLAKPLEGVFEYFADACNLQAITPHWLHFEILTQGPVLMRVGARIEYRVRLHGFPVRWRTVITAWEPPFRFVDEQERGPYRSWVHEHAFAPAEGGTVAGDRVRYEVPGGALANRLLVAPDLARIFRHRQKVLGERFGGRFDPVRIRRA